MKLRTLLLVILPIFTVQSSISGKNCCGKKNNTENQKVDEDETSTKLIVGHFAKMVNNFFNIVQDPHNAKNVGSNVANMMAGMVNIVTEAIKSGKLPKHPSGEEIRRFVKSLDKTKIVKLIRAKYKKKNKTKHA